MEFVRVPSEPNEKRGRPLPSCQVYRRFSGRVTPPGVAKFMSFGEFQDLLESSHSLTAEFTQRTGRTNTACRFENRLRLSLGNDDSVGGNVENPLPGDELRGVSACCGCSCFPSWPNGLLPGRWSGGIYPREAGAHCPWSLKVRSRGRRRVSAAATDSSTAGEVRSVPVEPRLAMQPLHLLVLVCAAFAEDAVPLPPPPENMTQAARPGAQPVRQWQVVKAALVCTRIVRRDANGGPVGLRHGLGRHSGWRVLC
eukprot:s786_g8.t1